MQAIHPLLVHFPIALLLTATLLDVAALLLKRPQLHRVSLWNLCLGSIAAALTVLSGRAAAEVAKHSFEIWQVMERHEHLGYITLTLSLLLCAWRLWKRDLLSTKTRLVVILLSLLMTASLALGAHLGGRLVYEFGVGGVFSANP